MINWTSREWRLIAERLVKDGVVSTDRGWLTSVLEAMKAVLPTDRWRKAHSLNNSKVILEPLLKEIRNLPPKPQETRQELKFQPLTLEAFTTDQLIAEVIERAVRSVTTELQNQIKLATTAQFFVHAHKHDPCVRSAERSGLPIVLVIGPKPGQQRELEQAHGGWLDLRFVSSDEPPASIDAHRASNHIILWTNFVSHQHQAHAKKVLGKFHYVNGGMSALHDKLKEITL